MSKPILTLRADATARLRDPATWIPFWEDAVVRYSSHMKTDPRRSGYWRAELSKAQAKLRELKLQVTNRKHD